MWLLEYGKFNIHLLYIVVSVALDRSTKYNPTPAYLTQWSSFVDLLEIDCSGF